MLKNKIIKLLAAIGIAATVATAQVLAIPETQRISHSSPIFTPIEPRVGLRQIAPTALTPPTLGETRDFGSGIGNLTLRVQSEHANIWSSMSASLAVLQEMAQSFDVSYKEMTDPVTGFAPHQGVIITTNGGFNVGDVTGDGRINILVYNMTGLMEWAGGFFRNADFGNYSLATVHLNQPHIAGHQVINPHEFQHLLFYMYYAVYFNNNDHHNRSVWFNEMLSAIVGSWDFTGYVYNEYGIRPGSGYTRSDFLNFANSNKNYSMVTMFARWASAIYPNFQKRVFDYFQSQFPPSNNATQFQNNVNAVNAQDPNTTIGAALQSATGETLKDLYFLFMENFASDGGDIIRGETRTSATMLSDPSSSMAHVTLWAQRSGYSVLNSDVPVLTSGGSIELRGYGAAIPQGATHEMIYKLTDGSADNPVLTITAPSGNDNTRYYVALLNHQFGMSYGADVYPLTNGVAQSIYSGGRAAYLFVATFLQNVNSSITYSWGPDVNPDPNRQNNADITAARRLIERTSFFVSLNEVTTQQQAKAYVESVIGALNLNGVNFVVNEGDFTADSFAFSVTLSKGSATSQTTRKLNLTFTTSIAISSMADLRKIGNDPDFSLQNSYFLTQDIDAAGETFSPIGCIIDEKYFTGVFDGRGFTISNLTINAMQPDFLGRNGYRGLFGGVKDATIKNLGLLDVDISGIMATGGLVAASVGKITIINCFVEGGSVKDVGTSGYAGGLVGSGEVIHITDSYTNVNVSGNGSSGGLIGTAFREITIRNCYATGDVSGNNSAGGLIGIGASSVDVSGNSIITNSYATGNVTSKGGIAGGLAGRVIRNTTITNSHATGNVKISESNLPAGGLVGSVGTFSDNSTISNSYATGNVESNGESGGLVGNMRGDISYSYATGNVSGLNVVGGLVGSHVSGSISYSYATGDVTATLPSADFVFTVMAGGLAGASSNNSNSFATGNVKSGFGGLMVTGITGDNCYFVGRIEIDESNEFWPAAIPAHGNNSYFNSENLCVNMQDLLPEHRKNARNTARMKQMRNYVGWDFENVWGRNDAINDGYPYLRWTVANPPANTPDPEPVHAETPSIAKQPQSANVLQGAGNHALSVEASVGDGGTLTYQWYRRISSSDDWQRIMVDATSSTYSVSLFQQTHYYRVIVTNTNTANNITGDEAVSIASETAKVNVFSIEAPHANVSIGIDGFSLRANISHNNCNANHFSYQWYINTIDCNETGTAIDEATQQLLLPLQIPGTRYYYVVVNISNDLAMNPNATITSATWLVQTQEPVVNAATPDIQTQPAPSTLLSVGATHSLFVDAVVTDAGILTYQWFVRREGSESFTPIWGEIYSSLLVPANAVGVNYYVVDITNTNNDATENKTATVRSNIAKVEVLDGGVCNICFNDPCTCGGGNAQTPIIANPEINNARITIGGQTELWVDASVTDGGTLTYQWYYFDENWNDVLIDGATNSRHTISKNALGIYVYYVVVVNTLGNRTAAAVTNWVVTVEAAISISDVKKSNVRHGIKFAQNIVSERAEISVVLPNGEQASETKVVIYDMTGNVVHSGASTASTASTGSATGATGGAIVWDLRNSAGRFVANRTYLVIAEVKDRSGRTHTYSARLGVKR